MISILSTIGMILNAIQKHETFFHIVVYLSSQKINLLIFFNFILVAIINLGSLLVWAFFDQIRSIETKVTLFDLLFTQCLQYIMDKSQKKIFHFLLLVLLLRSTFDIYKFISMTILFSFWIFHWLVYKRSDYLISRGSRGKLEHFKLLMLYNILILVDFTISYIFYDKFQIVGEKINEVYVIIGFEFVRLFLKAVQDNFKYTVSLIELHYREQWTEKGFVFNIISFVFDFIVLILNIKLFTYIVSRQTFPLYLLGEIIDTFVRLGKSIQLFIQSRQLINRLKKLPDVSQEDLVGVDNTCIICLEEIKKAKKLKCGHIFHLNCLRRWLEQNIQCPTCRDKIELDFNQRDRTQQQRIRNINRRRVRRQQVQQQQQQDGDGAAINEEQKQENQPGFEQEFGEEEEEKDHQNITQTQNKRTLSKIKNELNETDRLLEDLTKELIEETKKSIENDPKKQAFKDIFKIDEDELLDLIENDHNREESNDEDHNHDSHEEVKTSQSHNIKRKSATEELQFAQTINHTLFESNQEDGMRHSAIPAFNPYDLKSNVYPFQQFFLVGSIPYGLPCIALTRKTLDISLKTKQIEMINEKICKILRHPSEYVDISDEVSAKK